MNSDRPVTRRRGAGIGAGKRAVGAASSLPASVRAWMLGLDATLREVGGGAAEALQSLLGDSRMKGVWAEVLAVEPSGRLAQALVVELVAAINHAANVVPDFGEAERRKRLKAIRTAARGIASDLNDLKGEAEHLCSIAAILRAEMARKGAAIPQEVLAALGVLREASYAGVIPDVLSTPELMRMVARSADGSKPARTSAPRKRKEATLRRTLLLEGLVRVDEERTGGRTPSSVLAALASVALRLAPGEEILHNQIDAIRRKRLPPKPV